MAGQVPVAGDRRRSRTLILAGSLVLGGGAVIGCSGGSPGPPRDDAPGALGATESHSSEQESAESLLTVRPELPWQATGIRLQRGQRLTLDADGKYVFHADGYDSGPEGIPEAVPFLGAWPAPTLTGLALIGRIGETGDPFQVGRHAELEVSQPGELYLMVNDDILEENSGTLRVTATVASGPDEAGAAPGAGSLTATAAEPATIPSSPGQTPAGETLEIPEIGLRMSMPAHWQPGGVSGDSVLASYTAGSGLYPGLNVTLESRDGRSLEQVCDDWLSMLSDLTLEQRQGRPVSGATSLFVDASWSSPLGALRAVRLFLPYGNDIVVITFADRAASLDATAARTYAGYLDTVSLQGSGPVP